MYHDQETQVGPGFRPDESTPAVNPTPTFDPGSAASSSVRDSPQLLNVFRRFGDYHRLGQGGAGTVDSVSDPHLGRRVALKRLRPEHAQKKPIQFGFIREARVMAQLEHPGIVPVHELGVTEDGHVYFTMKRVKGQTLQEQLLASPLGAAPDAGRVSRRLEIFIRICEAMAFAHSRGVIHRDLKPANILIGEFGEVLVMDWGLAKVVGHPDDRTEGEDEAISESLQDVGRMRTIVGSLRGTPLYMSPEQARGEVDQLDRRSDIYALGVMLYEFLTDAVPSRGLKLKDIVHSVVHDPVIPPRDLAPREKIPRELNAICMKALEKNTTDRYQDVSAILDDLQAYRDDMPVSVLRESPIRRIAKWGKRHPVITASAGVAVVVAVVMIAVGITMRTVRMSGIIELADTHRRAGDALYEEKASAYRELQALHAEDAAGWDVAEARLTALHQESENNYDAALMMYATVVRITADVGARISATEIFLTRLRYARLVGDETTIEEQLGLLRTMIQDRSREGGMDIGLIVKRLEARIEDELGREVSLMEP